VRNTLELDDNDDRVELTKALEAAFAMRFGMAEAAACRTVGDQGFRTKSSVTMVCLRGVT
jgi:hypothetical protein